MAKIQVFVWEHLRLLIGSKNAVKFSVKNISPYSPSLMSRKPRNGNSLKLPRFNKVVRQQAMQHTSNYCLIATSLKPCLEANHTLYDQAQLEAKWVTRQWKNFRRFEIKFTANIHVFQISSQPSFLPVQICRSKRNHQNLNLLSEGFKDDSSAWKVK